MVNPEELRRRSIDLSARAKAERDLEVRERLIRMATLYDHLAESEQTLSDHPTSIVAINDLFSSR